MTGQRRPAVTRWALIVGNVVFGVILVGYGLHTLNQVAGTYLIGEKTTAQVQHCTPPSGNKGSYRCSGTWKLADGARGSGQIERTDGEDEGKTVSVRATKTGAVTGDGKAVLADSTWIIAVTVLGLFFLTAGPWKVRRLFAAHGTSRQPGSRSEPAPDPAG